MVSLNFIRRVNPLLPFTFLFNYTGNKTNGKKLFFMVSFVNDVRILTVDAETYPVLTFQV